jgi:hypothetical protein
VLSPPHAASAATATPKIARFENIENFMEPDWGPEWVPVRRPGWEPE